MKHLGLQQKPGILRYMAFCTLREGYANRMTGNSPYLNAHQLNIEPYQPATLNNTPMNTPWINQLGEFNPQVFRELKGRLKPRNLIIAIMISVVGQALLLFSFATQLPADPFSELPVDDMTSRHRYCTGRNWEDYSGATCVRLAGKIQINWQLWWQDIFLWLTIIGIFALLVVGTYMLIQDITQEERRGTLNFVRLSPQSTEIILGGKILGVPILLYVVALLAVPLHLGAGLLGQVQLNAILSIYTVGFSSCLFFYSAAVLFSFVSSWLGGFQAWLGSGAVLMFLTGTMQLITASSTHTPVDWLFLFSPFSVTRYALSSNALSSIYPSYQLNAIPNWQWFHLPIAMSGLGLVTATLLNYSLWTYWIWQCLKRGFRNAHTTILSKRQSYLFTACFEIVALGFAVQDVTSWTSNQKDGLLINLCLLSVWNLLLLLGLIAALSPHRQTLQDWARYRRERVQDTRGSWKQALLQDLIWGEKSPSLMAMAVNLAIIIVPMAIWILFSPAEQIDKIPALMGLPYFASLILIYAAIAQLILWMKTPYRMLWAAVAVSAAIVLPYVVFAMLLISPEQQPAMWLFSAFPFFATYYNPGLMTSLAVILGQWTILSVLLLQLTRQLRLSGASATKGMLSAKGLEARD